MRLRLRPVSIEAERYDGTDESIERIMALTGPGYCWYRSKLKPDRLISVGPELAPGEWLVRIAGRYLAMKDEDLRSIATGMDPATTTCAGCGRAFRTPQGLGMHHHMGCKGKAE